MKKFKVILVKKGEWKTFLLYESNKHEEALMFKNSIVHHFKKLGVYSKEQYDTLCHIFMVEVL